MNPFAQESFTFETGNFSDSSSTGSISTKDSTFTSLADLYLPRHYQERMAGRTRSSKPVARWKAGDPFTDVFFYDEPIPTGRLSWQDIPTKFPPDGMNISDAWIVKIVESDQKRPSKTSLIRHHPRQSMHGAILTKERSSLCLCFFSPVMTQDNLTSTIRLHQDGQYQLAIRECLEIFAFRAKTVVWNNYQTLQSQLTLGILHFCGESFSEAEQVQFLPEINLELRPDPEP